MFQKDRNQSLSTAIFDQGIVQRTWEYKNWAAQGRRYEAGLAGTLRHGQPGPNNATHMFGKQFVPIRNLLDDTLKKFWSIS